LGEKGASLQNGRVGEEPFAGKKTPTKVKRRKEPLREKNKKGLGKKKGKGANVQEKNEIKGDSQSLARDVVCRKGFGGKRFNGRGDTTGGDHVLGDQERKFAGDCKVCKGFGIKRACDNSTSQKRGGGLFRRPIGE